MSTSQEFHETFNMVPPLPEAELLNYMTLTLDSTSFSPNFQTTDDDATLDAVTKFEPDLINKYVPVSPLGPPEKRDFPGNLNFSVEINASDTHKKKYLYSHRLNRIYVDMKTNFPVQFSWNPNQCTGLVVRATTVFSDKGQAQKRVERCIQHAHDTNDNANLDQKIVKNVLHSAREMNTQGVYYCGEPSIPDSWYSVVVELPESGTCSHAYQFVCKNSCSTGINRRAIEIIFTLEDTLGTVYGSQTVGARVCACLRRDMQKDEETEGKISGKKRLIVNSTAEPKTKKIKLEVNNDLVTIPSLQIVGAKSAITGLEVMLNMQEQVISLKKNDPQAIENLKQSVASIKQAIETIKTIKKN